MKKKLLYLTFLFFSSLVFSQSADFITHMLETEKVTYGQACYFSAICQELVSEDANEIDAINAIAERGIIFQNVQPDDFINYKQTAKIFAQIWNIKGGLFYRLTKRDARYAFKQFKNDGVISQSADPSMIPSGVDLLNMFTIGEKLYVSKEGNE